MIEVTIGLSLLALIMLGLVSALRGLGDVAGRLEGRSQMGDELRMVPAFLDDTLRHASARLREGRPDESGSTWFVGEPDRLEWVGVMPARHGVGGLSHFRLFLEGRARGGMSLILQVAPFRGDAEAPGWSQFPAETVIESVSALEIRYRAQEGGEWLGRWEHTRVLPGWVAIAIQGPDVSWPPLVFQLFEAEFVTGG